MQLNHKWIKYTVVREERIITYFVFDSFKNRSGETWAYLWDDTHADILIRKLNPEYIELWKDHKIKDAYRILFGTIFDTKHWREDASMITGWYRMKK